MKIILALRSIIGPEQKFVFFFYLLQEKKTIWNWIEGNINKMDGSLQIVIHLVSIFSVYFLLNVYVLRAAIAIKICYFYYTYIIK
jgi:hypothetical protein